MSKQILLILGITLLTVISCNSQDNASKTIKPKTDMNPEDRKPAVAGTFYSGTEKQLRADLKELFSKAPKKQTDNVVAIISPHAGYVYSGEVAAGSFNQIDNEKEYKNIFIIGSTHAYPFSGASIYSKGNYITPLGTVTVNTKLAQELINNNEIFSFQKGFHTSEHSIEVQLPFLQYIMKKDFQIVPIIIGSQNQTDCKKIAEALMPWFNDDNLFVISSDFSHYPTYAKAVEIDNMCAEAIVSNSIDKLTETLESNKKRNVPGLATSMCGWTSVSTLMYLTKDRNDLVYKKIQYRNSGDVSNDTSRVVGYWSIASCHSKPDELKADSEFELTENEKKSLLKLARTTIEEQTNKGKVSTLLPDDYPASLHYQCGAFVSLHKDGVLCGCIGRFIADDPLYKIIQDMAVSASCRDSRFLPVKSEELNSLEIEISVLSPMKKIDSIAEIKLGVHGIYIKKGSKSGTFLPQVATETGWNLIDFLGHCAQDKAGIGWNGWKDAELFIYTANVFSENDFREIPNDD